MKKVVVLLSVFALTAGYLGLRLVDEAHDTALPSALPEQAHSTAVEAAGALGAVSDPLPTRVLPARPTSFSEIAVGLGRMHGEQLLEVFRKGIDSSDPEDQFLANQALGLCMPTILNLQAFDISHAPAESQIRAADSRRELRRICGPFVAVQRQDALRDARRFSSGIESADSPFSSYHLPDAANEEARVTFEARLRSNVNRYGPSALLWDAGNIADWLLAQLPDTTRHSPQPNIHDVPNKIHGAVALSMCHAGYDCSTSSVLYMNFCVQFGECDSTIGDGILRQFTSHEDRVYVVQLAARIGEALVTRDLAALKDWHAR